MPEQATFVTLDNIVNGWRQRVLFYLDTTIWGKIWEAADFLLNVALCVIYIVNTTVVDAKKDPARIPASNRQTEFLIAIIFLGQYIARFVIINRNHRTLEHAVVFFAFAAPVIAYFLSMHGKAIRDSYMSAGVLAIFYPARFLRLHYAINRLLALAAASAGYIRLTLIRQEAASLGGDIVVAILFLASVVHSGINWYSQTYNIQYDGFSFLDAIYFISMSALGQDGSIPRSTFSEIISMAIVALIAFTVPSRITRMVDLALKTSAYSKTVALPTASRHALVCGHIELESIRQFLHEFFNADHGPNIFKATIVILHGDEPSMEMKALLRDPAYTNRVFYVKGRATSFRALKKARIDLASCVYILTRKHCHGTGVEEDAETVLTALALSAFSTSVVSRGTDDAYMPTVPKFQVYAQTVLPGSIAHMTYLQTTRVVCVDEMRMGIMAQNCATPGFATLAFMLSTSVADHVDWDFSGVLAEAIAKSADDSWVRNYIHGIGQEIYQAHVPSSLVGKSFFKVARYFYRCHGLLVFGVGSFSPRRSPHHHVSHHPSVGTDAGYYQVLLSPRSYILQRYDILFAVCSDVQSVLDATLFAERVIIKSARVQNVASGRGASGHAETENSVSPVSQALPSIHLSRRPFIGMLASPQSPEVDNPTANAEPDSPVQLDSPRRVIARPGSARRQRPTNYISDSDSSYFSPGRKDLDTGMQDDGLSMLPSVKGAVRTRIEKVARRFDPIPSDIRDQVVICDASDAFPRNVELLIQSLKNAFEDDDLPIVILSPAQLDRDREQVLKDFSHVHIVRGTPLSQSDLKRTHIERAQKAIILGSCNDRTDRESSEASNDSAAILANMNIQSICGGQFFVTTELLDIESIRYLDHTQLLGEPLLKRTFMGGHIFMPGMIDTALCQCYFSSHILDVLRHLTFSHSPSDRVPSTVETPKTEEAAIIRSFRPGKLSLLYVPDRFIGKRYDALVLTLMKRHGSIPLGIYRIVNHEGQAFASVMCNPLPYMPLVPSDAVYVLGPDIAGWTHVSEGLRNLRIAPQTAVASESASPNSAGTTKGSKGSGTNQSRHTVYSHNTGKGSMDRAEEEGEMADSEHSETDQRNQEPAWPDSAAK